MVLDATLPELLAAFVRIHVEANNILQLTLRKKGGDSIYNRHSVSKEVQFCLRGYLLWSELNVKLPSLVGDLLNMQPTVE